MRFTEFKLNENSNKELESALVNTLTNLRGEADKRHEASEISFSAVEEIMKNTCKRLKALDMKIIIAKY